MKIGRLFIKILPKEKKQTVPVPRDIEPDLNSILDYLDMTIKFNDETDVVYDLLFEATIICRDYNINYTKSDVDSFSRYLNEEVEL